MLTVSITCARFDQSCVRGLGVETVFFVELPRKAMWLIFLKSIFFGKSE